MSIDENKEAVRRFLAAISKGGDIDQIDELVAPGYVNRGMGNVDLAGFKAMLATMPGATDVEINDVLGEGDAVVLRSTMSITLGTGQTLSARALTFYHLANGKILEDDTMTTPDLSQILGSTIPATAGA
jgi:ketosteroid isomerase-like protein